MNLLKPDPCRLYYQLLCLTIQARKTEVRGIAFRPLVVVNQRPREVTPHIDTVRHGTPHLIHMFPKVADFLLLTLRADAIFRDDNRLTVAIVNFGQALIEALRVDLPAILGVV